MTLALIKGGGLRVSFTFTCPGSTIARTFYSRLANVILSTAIFCIPSLGWASAILGNASSFAVLAGAAITNTGSSVVTGEIGVTPGTSVTGFSPPGVVTGGAIHQNDGVALGAKTDFLSAYATLGGALVTQNLTGGTLGSGILQSLTSGVYQFDTAAQLNGLLTLDGENNPHALFIFLIGTTLTTASDSSILLANGAFFENVFWRTGTTATIGSGSNFAGSILAGSSITFDPGATLVCGKALAQTAVTLTNNQISTNCQPLPVDEGHDKGVSEPSSLSIMMLGFLALAGIAWARRINASASLSSL